MRQTGRLSAGAEPAAAAAPPAAEGGAPPLPAGIPPISDHATPFAALAVEGSAEPPCVAAAFPAEVRIAVARLEGVAPSAVPAHCRSGKPYGEPFSRPRSLTRRALDAARRFLLSRYFQSGARLTVGAVFMALPVLVPALTYPAACLASVFFVLTVAVVGPDLHVGTQLRSAAMLVGSMPFGIAAAGCVLSLSALARRLLAGEQAQLASLASLPHDPGHVAALCLLSVAVLAVLSVNRVGADPPFLWVLGMLSCFGFGVTVIQGQFLAGHAGIWSGAVGSMLLSTALAAAGTALGAVTVAPSLAADELRQMAAAAIRGIGQCASGYASRQERMR